MNSNVLFVALYSYLDKNKYSEDEIISEIEKCYKKGASMVHFHINKVKNGIVGFFNILKRIEKLNILIAISLSDYKEIMDNIGKNKITNLCSVSLHASSCKVFNNVINQEYNIVEERLKEYLKNGFIPELSIFNEKGIENAIKLDKKYHGKFIASIYLGYPNELEATIENINMICSKLQDCSFLSIAIYNNNNLELTEEIIKKNAIVRVGIEDSIYNGPQLAQNNEEVLDTVNKIINKLGRTVKKFEYKESL